VISSVYRPASCTSIDESEPEDEEEADLARRRRETRERLHRAASAHSARSSRASPRERQQKTRSKKREPLQVFNVAIKDTTKAAGSVASGSRGTVQQRRCVPGLGYLVRLDEGGAVWVKPEGLWRVEAKVLAPPVACSPHADEDAEVIEV
jgi:hypothetical protein